MPRPGVITAIVGRHGVGKTSLIQAFSMPASAAPRHTSPTIGAAVINHLFALPDTLERGRHTIWDTAGQERYESLVPMYTRNCDILLVALPADEEPHPETVRRLLAASLPPIRSPKVVKGVLTKCDLVLPMMAEARRRRFEEIILGSPQAVNRQFEVHVYKTSAFTGEGVEDCIAEHVLAVHQFKYRKEEAQRNASVVLAEPAPRGRYRCGCMDWAAG